MRGTATKLVFFITTNTDMTNTTTNTTVPTSILSPHVRGTATNLVYTYSSSSSSVSSGARHRNGAGIFFFGIFF